MPAPSLSTRRMCLLKQWMFRRMDSRFVGVKDPLATVAISPIRLKTRAFHSMQKWERFTSHSVGPSDAERDFDTDRSSPELCAKPESRSTRNHMRTLYSVALALALPGCFLGQEVQPKPKFMESAVVEHRGTFATVTASDPRPLLQAVTALREEYGWVIDFEDPP